MTEPQIGDVLDDRFEIVALVGRGGMGSVFKATDLATGAAVAVKVPFFELEADPAFYSRFQREIEIGRRLDHPGVLKIVAVVNPSRPYLVTEFLEGQTLAELIQASAPLPPAQALRIAMQICDTLEYLHAHEIVHRDLKPSNVMLCRDGSVRIMDFGIAMAGAMRRLTFAGLSGRLGTAHYMAPEQVTGRRADARADVYSLGTILYEMTTGHAPFDEQPDLYSVMHARLVGDPIAPRAHNAAVTPAVEEIILRSLARDPADRYQSAAAMKADLCDPARVAITGRASRLRRATVAGHRWRLAQIAVLALLVPVVLFFVFLLMLRR